MNETGVYIKDTGYWRSELQTGWLRGSTLRLKTPPAGGERYLRYRL